MSARKMAGLQLHRNQEPILGFGRLTKKPKKKPTKMGVIKKPTELTIVSSESDWSCDDNLPIQLPCMSDTVLNEGEVKDEFDVPKDDMNNQIDDENCTWKC
jgi:hypothetical protein